MPKPIDDADVSVYDLTRWKPITHSNYIDQLGACFLTNDEPDVLETHCEQLDSGMLRIVTYAATYVVADESSGTHASRPYLMMLFFPEGSKDRPNLCFIRTDLELCV